MTQERTSVKHDEFVRRLEQAANQLEEAKRLMSGELASAGSKVKGILINTIEPFGKLLPFPFMPVFAKLYGTHATDVFLPTRKNKPGLLLEQDEHFSVFLSSEVVIFRAKTHQHKNGELSVDLEKPEEVSIEDYAKYGPKALEGILSFWREYFLVSTS